MDDTAAAWAELLDEMTATELATLATAIGDRFTRRRLVLLSADSLLDLKNGIRAQLDAAA